MAKGTNNKSDDPYPSWKEFVIDMPLFPQRQDSAMAQLADLYDVANKLGFYDAADFKKFYVK